MPSLKQTVFVCLMVHQRAQVIATNFHHLQHNGASYELFKNSGKLATDSVQNALLCRLLSKNVCVVIHKTSVLPAVLHVQETWSLRRNV